MNKIYNSLGVIGFGKMASAIVGGSGFERVFIYDKNPDVLEKNKSIYNIAHSIAEVFENSDVVLLATKPFVFDEVMDEVKKCYGGQLVMSILAGVKIEKYLKYIPEMKIIRIMPNTPALVQEGMSAICPSQNVEQKDTDFALSFMKSCGRAVLEDEKNIDIITALSGSGPAYYYRIIDLMAKSANKLGLDYKTALLLSSQTAMGASKMILEDDFDIEQLITNVTTKGGCTEVGNKVLLDSDISEILDKTIKDTMEKAQSLG